MASHAVRFLPAAADAADGALVLANTDDVVARADEVRQHAAVVLQFPKWTDGRAYSQAVLLRGRVRYLGEIRATGEVMADMVPLLARCGFDAVQLRADQPIETAQRTMGLLPTPYQRALSERSERAERPA